MRTSLKQILKIIWIHFRRQESVEDTRKVLTPLGCFTYREVCVATIEYWFERFRVDFNYFSLEEPLKTVGPILSLQFLSALRTKYPTWTIDHYMDAIRLPLKTVKWYLTVVDKLGPDYVWPKFMSD
ncbi:hypothetical protein M0804_000225 [Polistes exclamans]|nr:hypothetical protein M0804_000225 [Polistes exclamans]